MTHEAPAQQLRTVAEAMRQLKLSRWKVYQLMEAGELPYVKMPPHTKQAARRVKQGDIDDFVARNGFAAATP